MIQGTYSPQYSQPQFVPQGWLGDAFGQIAGPAGRWVGSQFGNANLGQQIGDVAGQLGKTFIPFNAMPQPQPQYSQPQYAQPQLVPQGWLGDAFGQIAGPVGRWVGGQFGNANLGQQIGDVAGQLGKTFIPFNAMPQPQPQYSQPQYAQPQLVPQGWLGDAFGQIAGPAGRWVGGQFGNANLGQQIGDVAGQLGKTFIPFNAMPQPQPQYSQPQYAQPQFVPQGWLGDAFGQIAAPVGRWVGGQFGNANLGQQIGDVAGQLGKTFIPFNAMPQPQPQYSQPQYAQPQFVPQGWLGDAFGQIAAPVGRWVGGQFGNANLGQQIGDVAGQLGKTFIPFNAMPQQQPQYAQPQFVPQGFLGGMLGGWGGGAAGGAIGDWLGNRDLGETIGGGIGGVIGSILPFNAAPMVYANQPPYRVAPQMWH